MNVFGVCRVGWVGGWVEFWYLYVSNVVFNIVQLCFSWKLLKPNQPCTYCAFHGMRVALQISHFEKRRSATIQFRMCHVLLGPTFHFKSHSACACVCMYVYIVTEYFLPGHKACAVVGILKDTRNHSLGEGERREREKVEQRFKILVSLTQKLSADVHFTSITSVWICGHFNHQWDDGVPTFGYDCFNH